MKQQAIDPRHDLVHTPDPGRERWRESYYFSFYDFRLGLGGYSSIGYRPSKGYSGSVNLLWGPDRATLVASERGSRTAHDDDHEVAGMTYRAHEPFGNWSWGFAGQLNDGGSAVDCDLEAIKGATESERPSVAVDYDLVFAPDQPLYMYAENPEWDGLFDGHLDEVGRVTGSVRIDGETYEIDGRGSKDHSWGVRDWARPKGWRWIDILFEEGPEVTLWRATFDGARWLQDGAIYADGAADPVTSFEEAIGYASRPPADRPATWDFSIGSEHHDLRGHAEILRCVPLRFPIRDAEGNQAIMWNDRTNFRCELADGRVGIGSAEFQIRV
ncbi:MAG: DUF7065 domain-containing protein [Thermoleophilaceae bacterium]